MKKFEQKDIFINTLKTYPKVKIIANNGLAYYNNVDLGGPQLNKFLQPFNPVDTALATEDGDILTTETGIVLIIEE